MNQLKRLILIMILACLVAPSLASAGIFSRLGDAGKALVEAKKVKCWVVLPAIRTDAGYEAPCVLDLRGEPEPGIVVRFTEGQARKVAKKLRPGVLLKFEAHRVEEGPVRTFDVLEGWKTDWKRKRSPQYERTGYRIAGSFLVADPELLRAFFSDQYRALLEEDAQQVMSAFQEE